MIAHENVGFRYAGRSTPTLNGVDFHLSPGEVVLLTGNSGSGKSTLLRTANGLIPHATSGTRTGAVHLAGEPIDHMRLSDICSLVGTVHQNPSDQLTHTWIDDEVAFGPQNLGYARGVVLERIENSLREVGLEDQIKNPIHILSGGQRQRLALACVMAMNPRVLVLDEPTTQLDPASTRNVLAVLERLRKEKNLSILLVDHRTEEALRWIDRVVVMSEGRIEEDADWDDLMRNPERLHDHGVELPDLLAAGHLLGCQRAPRSTQELASWCSENTTRPKPGVIEQPEHSSEPSGGVLVEYDHVSVRYSRKHPDALDQISFRLRQGGLVAVLGPNASGKSTLLRTLAGLCRPHSGAVTWDHCRDGQSPAALVPQDPDLTFIADTVWDETAFALRRLHLSEDRVRTRVQDALELTTLSEMADEPPFALSQGQRQRVALAAALAMQPRLLLLDEPTTGQDRRLVRSVLSRLKDSFVRNGGAILMSTHDLRTALGYADRVMILTDGRLIYDGTPQGVLADPRVLEAAGHHPPPLAEVSRMLGGPPLSRPDEFAHYWKS